MPLPTISDVHVNRPLTNISIAFLQKAADFIAGKVFPVIPVQKQSDVYYSYDNAYWNSDEMEVLAPNSESAGNGYAVDGTPNYFARLWAFHKDIDDQVRANADNPLNLDREATDYVTLKALLRRERLFATSYLAGSVWTRDYDGVSSSPGSSEVLQWSDATSTPIEDVSAAVLAIRKATGFKPNKLVLTSPVKTALLQHPDIIDRIKGGATSGNPALANLQTLAQIFDIEEVLEMGAIYNTAKEGGTASHDFIGGKKALLVYAPPAPGLMTPSAGYIFSWTGMIGAGPEGMRILRMRDDLRHSDRVEIQAAWDMKKISADLGAFWDSIVA